MQYLLFFLLFFFSFALPVQAQSADEWTITNFHSDIAIQPDGIVQVTETIDVDFDTLAKRGIYRDIPVVYEDDKGEKTYTKIAVSSITQDGTTDKAEYKVTHNDNNLRIRIGDPDVTISGKHQYTITYQATGVLRSFADYDELYWNVTGNDWEATMQKASATVTVPKEKIDNATCFEGYQGYTNPCHITKQSPTSVSFTTTRDLPQTQGLTIVTAYTKGMVPILTVPKPKTIEEDIVTRPSAIAFLITLCAAIILIMLLWMSKGRDFWYRTSSMLTSSAKSEQRPLFAHETNVVEFTPPDKLRPAEIGVLMDEKADTLDITSTIIDLAHRGFLTITEVPKKWLFGSTDYILTQAKTADASLLGYEKLLLNKLFATQKVIKLSSLKQTFYDDLAAVKKKLYEDMVHKKLFIANPESIRTRYILLGLGFCVFGFIILIGGINLIMGPITTTGAAIIIGGILLLFASKNMPRRTALGREYYRRVKGYRLFIDGAEKYRQRFFEDKSLFNEILPYAIVFGLTGKFARAMKDMGVTPATPTWYIGHHAFVAAAFASDVDSFSKSLSTAIASTPSSGGGFSGGSSGGGFGGGGGGSW
ncbi:MAG: DUF2207 domain-containing protein [Patescibacteria group bacterium]